MGMLDFVTYLLPPWKRRRSATASRRAFQFGTQFRAPSPVIVVVPLPGTQTRVLWSSILVRWSNKLVRWDGSSA